MQSSDFGTTDTAPAVHRSYEHDRREEAWTVFYSQTPTTLALRLGLRLLRIALPVQQEVARHSWN